MKKIIRISKDEYYLGITKEVTKRAVCFRRVSGALIFRRDQIISTGYTGSPRKTKDCFVHRACLRDKLNIPQGHRYELCRSVHAEQNAIINAGRAGVSFFEGDMYIYARTLEGKPIDAFPCLICKKMIINAGLIRVICSQADGGVGIHFVKDWVEEWKENDILDDNHQYG